MLILVCAEVFTFRFCNHASVDDYLGVRFQMKRSFPVLCPLPFLDECVNQSSTCMVFITPPHPYMQNRAQDARL